MLRPPSCTVSSMISIPAPSDPSAPSDDEVEITLLGRGVGESVVVHLGDRRWMIVDSFVHERVPAALLYLDEIGVGHGQVVTIVITHFHRDHYRGVGTLHECCQSARLCVTRALRTEKFSRLYGDDTRDPWLDDLPAVIDDELMWRRLVTDEPRLMVAPYWPSGIPRETDVMRLCGRGRDVWQAAPSARHYVDEFGNRRVHQPLTGRITARRAPGEDSWRTHAVAPAFEVDCGAA